MEKGKHGNVDMKLDAKKPMNLLKSLLSDEGGAKRVSDAGIEKAPRPSASGIKKTPEVPEGSVKRDPKVTHKSSDPIHKHAEKLSKHLEMMKDFLRNEMKADTKEIEQVLAVFRKCEERRAKLK